ncbi:efflux RND transporter periplasmic adaptor subunit [Ferrovum sp. PN-J185]|uniref:efflux RND transporter periplasmic adaptor subunit n=1 Tax=Ferrovum sp. PN-J185 TaxID=1356306 RepID=UPI000798DC2C|nr:efflux RND transporter periplasmic adaptor subunit [Ferrovum sp. PN-J185]KXW56722.1 solvent efflux pump periplasmic linker SrpA precursor [Ferrovum sp. PN-J185]MCC6067593.1 efflux RND transporter periplasmic adaptor subunit [Ferrovum sp. PN-J185]
MMESHNSESKSLTKKRMIIMLIIFVVVMGGIVGFNLFKQHAIKKYMNSMGIPPQTVTTTIIHYSEWTPTIDEVATLRAVRGVNISTESAGLVKVVKFHSGQHVKKDQILLVINNDAEVAQLKVLKANLSLAKLVLERDRKQYGFKAISLAQLQSDEADYQSKTAQVQAQQALVEKKIIRAPFSGQIGITTVNPGQYINVGDKIATLQQTSPILVDFTVPQQQLRFLKTKQPISLTTDVWPKQIFKGEIEAISSEVDQATRNIAIQGAITNDQHQLLPGMFTMVHWQYGKAQSYLTLPQTAITFNPYGATVFVVKHPAESKLPVAQQVFITTGATRGDQVAVMSGIKEGDEVVTSGQLKLKTGIPVSISHMVEPPNNPAPTPQEH